MSKALVALGCSLLGVAASAAASSSSDEAYRLGNLSIEELMNEPVTSVSKKEIKLSDSPAAIFVINNDDLRRSGMATLPEALRLVPGLDVARISSDGWAITSRGFNSEFATKLLVLVDGRTIYSPASAGVFWNAQDAVLEDMERIEVIRGPGATLWGANAVNGVINITSKDSKDTQGVLLAGAVGSEERPAVTLRYGGALADTLHYRAYVKYFKGSNFDDQSGTPMPDAWHTGRAGFRSDWQASAADQLTVQGDYYHGEAGKRVEEVSLSPAQREAVDSVANNKGNNVLARWTRDFSASSQMTLQAYYDHIAQGNGYGMEYRNSYDVDFQHRFALTAKQDVVWGAGYRYTALTTTSSFTLTWAPESRQVDLFNYFVQDEITLAPERWRVTLGSKFEHNNLNGWEIQPSARLLWTPVAHQSVWTAISHAAATPAVLQYSGRLNATAFQPPSGLPILVSFFGSPSLGAEHVDAYEVGYRLAPAAQWSVDMTGFYNRYSDLTTLVPNATGVENTPAPTHLLISSTWQNALTAHSYGVELATQWQATERWRLSGSYTWLRLRTRLAAAIENKENNNPQHEFQLHSYFNLTRSTEFNGALYFVDRVIVDAIGTQSAVIPAHTRLDLGYVWRPAADFEIGLWGQNLLEPRHLEFGSAESSQLTQIPRTVRVTAAWRF